MMAIVLPAYNEQAGLPDLLSAIPAAMQPSGLAYQVIVVDDGSTDETAALVQRHQAHLPILLVPHPTNLGLGAALRTGLTTALQLPERPEVIVTLDADNTHPPALIPGLAEGIAAGEDMVIASRYAPGGAEVGLAWPRKVLSRGASWLLRWACPIPGVRDYTCGFRAYRRAILERGFAVYGDRLIEEAGFTCMAELLIKLAFLRARVGERPLVLRYDLKAGRSKMKVVRTIVRYFHLLRRLKSWRASINRR